jgi:outer membrane lipoprotein carrier protein
MRLFVAFCLLLAGLPAFAADAESIIEEFTRGLSGLEGRFEQQVLDPQGTLKEQSSGSIALAVPRQLRWEYEAPFPQLIVADGEHLFVFDPDLEQVTVRRQIEDEQQSPLLALIDPEERQRQFTLKSAGLRDGLQWVELESKLEEAQIRTALLGLDGQTLARMEFIDSLGQRTRISFTQWRRNPVFEAGAFRFQVPAGVDVVGDYTPSAEVLPLGE